MDNSKWFAVYTKPRWEKKVHQQLLLRGFESYCPLNKVRKKWTDRIKIIEEPLFKSYVFVKVEDQDLTPVRMVKGVVNFVYWQGKPALIRDGEILTIKRFLNEHEKVEVENLEIKANQTVRIYSGILMDREGRIVKVKGNQVEVIIESLGFKLVASLERNNVGLL